VDDNKAIFNKIECNELSRSIILFPEEKTYVLSISTINGIVPSLVADFKIYFNINVAKLYSTLQAKSKRPIIYSEELPGITEVIKVRWRRIFDHLQEFNGISDNYDEIVKILDDHHGAYKAEKFGI
jgi:hypothetical protein